MNGHILVFDSGLGGTTILAELIKLLPHCTYSYALDNEAFPYGSQTDAFLLERCLPLFDRLLKAAKPDVVVIACNTASTLFLDKLREHYPETPFVGVVPAIKPAAAISQSQVIALLATPATIRRSYISTLQNNYACDCQMIRLSHPDLVFLAEQKIRDGILDIEKLQTIVEGFKAVEDAHLIDTFVLGCTHFPAIASELAELWGKPANWIDSGAAIAKRTANLLDQLAQSSNEMPPATLYLTAATDGDKYLNVFKKISISQLKVIEIG